MAMSGCLRAVMQFDFGMATPKALANFSPGLERSDNPGIPIRNKSKTLKAFANSRTLPGFNKTIDFVIPRLSQAPTLGLKLANVFGVKLLLISKCITRTFCSRKGTAVQVLAGFSYSLFFGRISH